MADREDESSLSAEEKIMLALEELGTIVDSQADRLSERLAPVNRSVANIERKLVELGYGPADKTDQDAPSPDGPISSGETTDLDQEDSEPAELATSPGQPYEDDSESPELHRDEPMPPEDDLPVAVEPPADEEPPEQLEPDDQASEGPEASIDPARGTDPDAEAMNHGDVASQTSDTTSHEDADEDENQLDDRVAARTESDMATPPHADLPFEDEGLSEEDINLADESLKSELVNLFDDGDHVTRQEPSLGPAAMPPPVPSIPKRSRPIYLLLLALLFLAGSIGIGAFVWFELTTPELPVASDDDVTTQTAGPTSSAPPEATSAPAPAAPAARVPVPPTPPAAQAPAPPRSAGPAPKDAAATKTEIAALPEPALATETAADNAAPSTPAGAGAPPQTPDRKETPASINPEIDALRDLAAAGDSVAQNELAVRYLVGRGIEQNYDQAARWLQEAATGGVVSAQYNLGVLYDSGRGVESDPIEALIWFHSAAEKGHGRAQYALAAAYAAGRGIERNSDTALKWLRRAAEENVLEAQSSLANILATSPVSPGSLKDAYYWYRLADANGDNQAAERAELVAARLTSEDRADVNRRVSAFIAAKITGKRSRTAPSAAPVQPAPPAPPAPPVPPVSAPIAPAASAAGVQNAPSPPASNAEQVRTIQSLLKSLGFNPGPADGALDAKTHDAIRNYQRALGLVVNGEPSEALLAHLRQISGLRK